MTTEAAILMITVQGLVTVAVVYYLIRAIRSKNDKQK